MMVAALFSPLPIPAKRGDTGTAGFFTNGPDLHLQSLTDSHFSTVVSFSHRRSTEWPGATRRKPCSLPGRRLVLTSAMGKR